VLRDFSANVRQLLYNALFSSTILLGADIPMTESYQQMLQPRQTFYEESIIRLPAAGIVIDLLP
jgi:hypothetical protein